MTPPAVMSAEEARAWLAGAQAARAADVAEVRRLAGGHSAAVRWYCAETTAASPEWSERADYESRASATLQGAGDALAALPLPSPPQTAPAPPQSPLPSPDGGTGPQGDGAPAGGCGVAEAAARRREQAMAVAGQWSRCWACGTPVADVAIHRARECREERL